MGKPSCKHLLHAQVLIPLKPLYLLMVNDLKLEVNPTFNNCINLPGTNYLNNVCLGRDQSNDPGFSTLVRSRYNFCIHYSVQNKV